MVQSTGKYFHLTGGKIKGRQPMPFGVPLTLTFFFFFFSWLQITRPIGGLMSMSWSWSSTRRNFFILDFSEKKNWPKQYFFARPWWPRLLPAKCACLKPPAACALWKARASWGQPAPKMNACPWRVVSAAYKTAEEPGTENNVIHKMNAPHLRVAWNASTRNI